MPVSPRKLPRLAWNQTWQILTQEEEENFFTAPLSEQARDAVYGEAKKTLPKLLAEYPDLRDDDEQLQNAFRLRLKELIQNEHKNIPGWQTRAYIEQHIITYWETFKANALNAEKKPAALA